MTTSEWTPERIQILIGHWAEGLSTSEIGRRLGVTKNAVVGKVHRLGLKKRASPIRTGPSLTTKTPSLRPALAKIRSEVSTPAQAQVVPPAAKKKSGAIVRMEALRPGMCNWPVGEPGADDFHFCGDEAVPEKPYCAEHCARAYVKTVRRGQKTAAA